MNDSVEMIKSSITYQNALNILKYATKYKITSLQEEVIKKIGPDFETFFDLSELLNFADKELVKIILTREDFNYNEKRLTHELIVWLKAHPEYRFLVENLKGPTISLIITEMNRDSQLMSPYYDSIRKSLIQFLNEKEPQYVSKTLTSSHQTTYISPNHISPEDSKHSPINSTPFKPSEKESPSKVDNTQLTQPESQLGKEDDDEEELFEKTTTFSSSVDLQNSLEKSMMKNPPKSLKLLLVGPSESGKTNYVHKLISKKLSETYESTVGVEIYSCNVAYVDGENSPDYNIKLSIWDVAGRDDLSGDRNTFYYGTNLLLVFADNEKDAQTWKEHVFKTLEVDYLPTIVASPTLFKSPKRDLYEPIGDLLRLYFASDSIHVVIEEDEDELADDVNVSPISDPDTPKLITTPPPKSDDDTLPAEASSTTAVEPSTDDHSNSVKL